MYRGECPLMTGKFHHKRQICSIHCYPPITEVTQSTYNQNGEFEAAHCRKANCQRRLAARRPPKGRIKRCCINQLYIYLTLITSTFSCFCSEETSKGCDLSHPPVMKPSPTDNNQNGEFEAAHCRKANCQRRLDVEKPLVP